MRPPGTPAPKRARPVWIIATLLVSAALQLGCAEERLPSDPPSETGTITISVGAA
jgi:hypothetical protein